MIFLPGAFNHTNELLLLLLKIFKCIPLNLIFYDGVDNSVWNGGKPNILCKSKFSYKTLKLLNSKNIGVYLTFSNFYINDLSLKHENEILEQLNESKLNGVILTNKKLYDYIKKNHKNLNLSLSVTYFKNWNHNIYDFKMLEDCFNFICPMYSWVFDEKFINKIDVSKYKIMLNDTCKVNCSNWHNHFEHICKYNLLPLKEQNVDTADKIYQCWIKTDKDNPNVGWQKDKLKYGVKHGMDIDIEGLKILYNYGFRTFKLNGRDLKGEEFLDDISYNLKNIQTLKLL